MNRLLLTLLMALMAWLPLAGAIHGAHSHSSITQCTSADPADANCPASSCALCIAFAALGAALAPSKAAPPRLAARPPQLAAMPPAARASDWLAPSSRDPPPLSV